MEHAIKMEFPLVSVAAVHRILPESFVIYYSMGQIFVQQILPFVLMVERAVLMHPYHRDFHVIVHR